MASAQVEQMIAEILLRCGLYICGVSTICCAAISLFFHQQMAASSPNASFLVKRGWFPSKLTEEGRDFRKRSMIFGAAYLVSLVLAVACWQELDRRDGFWIKPSSQSIPAQ
jgi:hypothetical protein